MQWTLVAPWTVGLWWPGALGWGRGPGGEGGGREALLGNPSPTPQERFLLAEPQGPSPRFMKQLKGEQLGAGPRCEEDSNITRLFIFLRFLSECVFLHV